MKMYKSDKALEALVMKVGTREHKFSMAMKAIRETEHICIYSSVFEDVYVIDWDDEADCSGDCHYLSKKIDYINMLLEVPSVWKNYMQEYEYSDIPGDNYRYAERCYKAYQKMNPNNEYIYEE